MRGRVVVAAFLICASCAHASLNRSESRGPHQDDVRATDVPVRGFDVTVAMADSSVSGELIAVDERFLYLNAGASPNDWIPMQIPRAQIVKVVVEVTPSLSTNTGLWTALGCASTVSHGGFLIFSGPIWLGTGLPTSIGESYNSHAEAPNDQLSQLFQYARFPQGLPKSFGSMKEQLVQVSADAGVIRDAAVPIRE
jgi:hypothetical protein